MTATRDLAKFITDLHYDNIPPSAVYAAKQCLLDWLGNAVRGSQERAAVLLCGVLNDTGHEATIFLPTTKKEVP